MATYTVNITGNLNSSYGYATINGTTITSAGTKTYTSKPTISVYVGTGTIIDQNLCAVKLNGTTVKSGQGSYSLDFGDDNVVNISFTAKSSTGTYYTADITTQKTSSGGDSVDGGDGSEHYTLIGNAAREIEGGTVLIGGVLREIESGLVLVGGVAREIAFKDDQATITITTEGSVRTYAWVIINGTEYTSDTTVEVPKGTNIVMWCTTGTVIETEITLNGTVVNSGHGDLKYVMSVTEDTTIKLIKEKLAGTYHRGRIVITTGG